MAENTEQKTISKWFDADIQVSEGERAVVATITTSAIDRDGDVIVPDGVDATDFEKNPVVAFAHSYYRMPVGKCTSIRREEGRILAKTVFAKRPESLPADQEWFPDTLLSLYQQGVMRAFSIGFVPKEMRDANSVDKQRYGEGCQRVFSKVKLLEYSCVPIPANQDAVAMAVSKGVVSAAAGKAVWGIEAKQQTDEKHGEEKQEESPAPQPQPKRRVVRILPARKNETNLAGMGEKAVKFVDARRRGLIILP